MQLNKYLKYVASLLVVFPAFALGNWETKVSKDEMTGAVQAFAISPSVKPTKNMGFPYSDVVSWVSVGCEKNKLWVYFGFSSNANIDSNNNEINTRIKWDAEILNVKLSMGTNSRFIHFSNDEIMVKKLISSKELLLELPWHSQGNVYFKYSLKGSSSSIQKIAKECGLTIEKQSVSDYFKLALSEMSFHESYGLSLDGNKLLVNVEGGNWKPYFRDSSATDRISKALKVINKVALKHNLNYELHINVWGTTSKIKSGGSDAAMPFKGGELKSLLDKAISKNPEMKDNIQHIKVGDKEPTYYGKDVKYEILVGKIKSTNEQIEIQVVTK